MTGSRDIILNKIKKALQTAVPLPFPAAPAPAPSPIYTRAELAKTFEQNFEALQGNLHICPAITELEKTLRHLCTQHQWIKIFCADQILVKALPSFNFTEDLAGCDVSFTGCEALVARTGSMLLSSSHAQGRTGSVYAPVHLCVAYHNQLVYDIQDAFAALHQNYGNDLPSFLSLASGPSRTADIEKTLVTGVHGPKSVHCVLVQ